MNLVESRDCYVAEYYKLFVTLNLIFVFPVEKVFVGPGSYLYRIREWFNDIFKDSML